MRFAKMGRWVPTDCMCRNLNLLRPCFVFFFLVGIIRGALPRAPGRWAAVGGFAPPGMSSGTRGRVPVLCGAVRWWSPPKNPALTRGFTG